MATISTDFSTTIDRANTKATANAFAVADVSYRKIPLVKTPEIAALCKSIIDCKLHDDPFTLLPSNPREGVSFALEETTSSFANTIRRTLLEELPVTCLDLKTTGRIKSDDRFVCGKSDSVARAINFLTAVQYRAGESKLPDLSKYIMFILKSNTGTESIDIRASDIRVAYRANFMGKRIREAHARKHGGAKSKRKHSGTGDDSDDDGVTAEYQPYDSQTFEIPDYVMRRLRETKNNFPTEIPAELIVADLNQTIIGLAPGKTIFIVDIQFSEGYAYQDAGKFSLLNSVKYKPVMTPYDMYTMDGTRSISHSPTKFSFSFETAGNCSAKLVMERMRDRLIEQFVAITALVKEYQESQKTDRKLYYTKDSLTVSHKEGVYEYSFADQYITTVAPIAHEVYVLDPHVDFCSFSVERFDTRIGNIRIIHPNHSQIILDAIQSLLRNVDIIHERITEAIE